MKPYCRVKNTKHGGETHRGLQSERPAKTHDPVVDQRRPALLRKHVLNIAPVVLARVAGRDSDAPDRNAAAAQDDHHVAQLGVRGRVATMAPELRQDDRGAAGNRDKVVDVGAAVGAAAVARVDELLDAGRAERVAAGAQDRAVDSGGDVKADSTVGHGGRAGNGS